MGPETVTDNPQPPSGGIKWDAVAGAVLVLIGIATLYAGSNLRVGTIGRMGPGYVPTSVAIALAVLGGILLVAGLMRPAERVEWPGLRPTIVVLACPAIFALLIGPLGLVLTVIIVASVARLADAPKFDLEALLVPLVLAGFCVLIFSYLLQLPTPLWP